MSLVTLSLREKRFPTRTVLSDIAFSIQPGEIVSLVGPSGCGKSTLLRLIAGLDHDFDGEVTAPSDIGFVFQEPRLLPWLTVAGNVGFNVGKKDPRVLARLTEVGLAEVADAWPKALSGGMAQRAGIARALVDEPSLLLLDEPFSALDAFTRARLQDLLLSIARAHAATLLLVTHDIAEAVYLSDRVLVLSGKGRLAGEIVVDTPRPRQRLDPALGEIEAKALSLLDTGQILASV